MSYAPQTSSYNADYRLALQLQADSERQVPIPSPESRWSAQARSDEEYAMILQMQENDTVFSNANQAPPGQYPPYIAPPGNQGTGGGFSNAPLSPPQSPTSSQAPSVFPPPQPEPPRPPQPPQPSTFQNNTWTQQPPTPLPPPSPPSSPPSASNTTSGHGPAVHNPIFFNYPEPQIPLPSSTMVIPTRDKQLTSGERCGFSKSITRTICWCGCDTARTCLESRKCWCGAGPPWEVKC